MRASAALLTGLLLAGCGSARSPASAGAPDPAMLAAASEIMRLEEAWGRALSARDTAFFRRTLADDFTGTGGSGVRSKAMVIEELGRGVGRVPVPRLEQTQVKLYGEVAVVTGLAAYEAEDGAPASRTRFTEVWVKRASGWQAVHGHYNGVPGAAP